MKKIFVLWLLMVAALLALSLAAPPRAGALDSPWATPWELTPPHRSTPTSGPPPPDSDITPIPHRERSEERNAIVVEILPAAPTATISVAPVRATARSACHARKLGR